MGTVRDIYLSNLPTFHGGQRPGLTWRDVKDASLQEFPTFFEEATLEVNLFDDWTKNNKTKRFATATGFRPLDLEQLKIQAFRKTFPGTSLAWRFAEDYGEERHEWGEFREKIPSHVIRDRERSRGHLSKKPMELFRRDFIESIGHGVFTGFNVGCIKYEPNFEIGPLDMSSLIQETSHKKDDGIMLVFYWSSLDHLQSITANSAYGYKFCTHNKMQTTQLIDTAFGLGVNDENLNFLELQQTYKYVPFSKMRGDLFDMDRMNRFEGRCWRCTKRWTFLGIDYNLNFVAATCECPYGPGTGRKERDIMDRAASFPGEEFTRLYLCYSSDGEGGQVRGQTKLWKPWLVPMQGRYDNANKYRNIVGPCIQEDWKSSTLAFKLKSEVIGVVTRAVFVEQVLVKGNACDEYSIQARVPKRNVWSPDEQYKIGGLTGDIIVTRHGQRTTEKRKGTRISTFQPTTGGREILVTFKMALARGDVPVVGTNIKVSAKPTKSAYDELKRTLTKWVTEPQNFTCLDFILTGNCAQAIPPIPGLNRGPGAYDRQRDDMITNLNPVQRVAFERALESPVAAIQGPPGTGKTFLCGVFITAVNLYEDGLTLCAGSSNFSTDGLAKKIVEVARDNGIPIAVLRIYSKKRELNYIRIGTTPVSGQVPVLHEEVLASPTYLAAPELQNIRNRLAAGRRDLLTQQEEKLLDTHYRQEERTVMARYDVFAGTPGALSDGRVKAFNDHRDTKKKITTIVLDEVATIPQPYILPVLTFGQIRVTLVGDPQQLRGLVHSFSSEMARLPFSEMEWLKEGRRSNVPWTMLVTQFRMRPKLRALVSRVTYNNQLQDDRSVVRRFWQGQEEAFRIMLPAFKSNIVVFDHNKKESLLGASYYNEAEVKITRGIIQLLTAKGIKPADITVLPMYEAQRKSMSLKLTGFEGITIATCDSYQGRENQVIILSMTRSGGNTIGFAGQANRVNVAISRAREMLFVCIDFAFFRKNETGTIKALLDQLILLADIRKAKQAFPNIPELQ